MPAKLLSDALQHDAQRVQRGDADVAESGRKKREAAQAKDQSLAGHSKVSAESLSSHTNCRLGVWYQAEGRQFAHLPAYRNLDAPHARVHQGGKTALERGALGDVEGAVSAVAGMEAASVEVLEGLQRIADSSAH